MDIEALKLELTNLSQEKQYWLATRNALRVLPMIAVEGENFPFWKQNAELHLFSIFRAMNMALYLSTQWTVFEKRGFASLTTDITADFAYAASRSCELTTTSLLAIHATNCAAAAAHASSLSGQAYAAAANSINYTGFNDFAERVIAYKVFSADIASLKSNPSLPLWIDLWYGKQSDNMRQFEKCLLQGLRSLGLSYWADEYMNWIAGRFNHLKMERSIFMPEQTIKDGPENMLKYLQDKGPSDDGPNISDYSVVPKSYSYDLFISHASEDKDSLVRELAAELVKKGLKVWYDEFSLSLGDSLRRSIDHGLSNSRFGAVVLSNNFFAKEWPQKELDGLVAREDGADKVILPIWHNISKDEITLHSPILADRLGVSSHLGVDVVVNKILQVVI